MLKTRSAHDVKSHIFLCIILKIQIAILIIFMRKQAFLPLLLLWMGFVSFWACNDDYLYLQETPEAMKRSIYSTLQTDGRFTTYVKMLQRMDSAYVEILSRTGSRTVFAPTDEAFNQFFTDNPYGYRSVADMPASLVKTFLSYYTLENAYVVNLLGTGTGYKAGESLRRYTTYDRTDSILYTDQIPDNAQFQRFKGKKMYLNTPGEWTLLNFTQPYFQLKGMTNQDFNLLYPDASRTDGDVHIFNAKILSGANNRNIVAANGYIHVVDKVVLPPKNMYEYVRDKQEIGIFKKLLERFCEPVYDPESTHSLWDRNPGIRDSVYNVGFFYTGDRYIVDEYGNQIKVDNLLFSPAVNDASGAAGTHEMPVLFAPTDKAMNEYLAASFFKDYGTWDNVPDNIVAKFLNTHMKKQLSDSYPSHLATIVDDMKGDLMFPRFNYSEVIKDVQVCRNGLVYVINKVVLPRDFNTVVAPIMNDERTKIINWLINATYNNKQFQLKYNYYLTSVENEFTLIVPVDEAFVHYLDPVNQSNYVTGGKKMLNFRYLEDLKGVTYYYCDMNGDSIATPGKPNFTNTNDPVLLTVQNRLKDIMDYHIVVGRIDDNQTYVQTKGGTFFKVDRQGGNLRFQGAGDIEAGTYVNVIDKFMTGNGMVYFVDKRITHTLNSPYHYLEQTADCSMFYEMLMVYNDPDATFFDKDDTYNKAVVSQSEYKKNIFAAKDGIDFVFPFLGSYDYTILAPTNAAMTRALNERAFKTTDEIKAITTAPERIEAIKKNILFLKNHFIDKSLFTDQFYKNSEVDNYQWPQDFTTGAKNSATKTFYTVKISRQGDAFVIQDGRGNTAKTVSGTTNTLTRQYKFSNSSIGSTSRTVIHQIDHVLMTPIQ